MIIIVIIIIIVKTALIIIIIKDVIITIIIIIINVEEAKLKNNYITIVFITNFITINSLNSINKIDLSKEEYLYLIYFLYLNSKHFSNSCLNY